MPTETFRGRLPRLRKQQEIAFKVVLRLYHCIARRPFDAFHEASTRSAPSSALDMVSLWFRSCLLI